MRGRAAAVLALCGLAACGGEPDAGDQPEVMNTPEEMVTGDDPGIPVQPIPRSEQDIAAGTLAPVNNSGVSGSVTLRGLGERTEVLLNVTGLTDATRRVEAAIVRGTCEQPGAEVARLDPIPVGAGNIAAATDTVDVAPTGVLDGEHAFVVQTERAGPATPPLACAPLVPGVR